MRRRFADASGWTNKELAKAHALWPLLWCVATALRCGLVFVALEFMELCVCGATVVFMGCVCGVCDFGVLGVVCVVGATVVVLMVS